MPDSFQTILIFSRMLFFFLYLERFYLAFQIHRTTPTVSKSTDIRVHLCCIYLSPVSRVSRK